MSDFTKDWQDVSDEVIGTESRDCEQEETQPVCDGSGASEESADVCDNQTQNDGNACEPEVASSEDVCETNDGESAETVTDAGENEVASGEDVGDCEGDKVPDVADATVAQNSDLQPSEDGSDNKGNEVPRKSFIEKLPPKIRKLIEYVQSHEDVRQMVMFFLFSILCGLSQMIVTYALSAGLKLSPSLASNFDWFVFHFETSAEFVGFLIGSVVGQTLTFLLNRKKTFNRPDYLVLRAIMYTVMAIVIIIMQTYLGGVVTTACYRAKADADGFLELLFNLTGQAVAGIAALVVSFLCNKFLVMRDWGKKKREREQVAQNSLANESESVENAVDTAELDGATEA